MIEEAVCKHDSSYMERLTNVATLIKQNVIDKAAFAHTARAALLKCRHWTMVNDPVVGMIFNNDPDPALKLPVGNFTEWHNAPPRDAQNVQAATLGFGLWEAGRFEQYLEYQASIAGGLASTDAKYAEHVQQFIDKGNDPNQSFCSGQTPLYFALFMGRPDAVRTLVRAGADINKTFVTGNPIGSVYTDQAILPNFITQNLFYHFNAITTVGGANRCASEGPALSRFATSAIDYAFQNTSDANYKLITTVLDFNPVLPPRILHKAVKVLDMRWDRNQQLFADLLQRGAGINEPDDQGKTILALATSRGYVDPDVLKFLIAHGASLTPGAAPPPPVRAAAIQREPPSAQAAAATPGVAFGEHTLTSTANVRASPSRSAALAGTLNVGDRITVDATSNDHQWFRITFPGGSGWVLARVLAKSTAPSAAHAAAAPAIGAKPSTILAACPSAIDTVQLEAEPGKYNPPAFLAPDRDNGRPGPTLHQEWTGLGGHKTDIHCHRAGAPPDETTNLSLPAGVSTCVRQGNQFSCF